MHNYQNFHISLPCADIEKTKEFYMQKVGCKIGRSSINWCDFDLYGNQITFTESGAFNFSAQQYSFEQFILPSFHFGIILSNEEWKTIYNKLSEANIVEMGPRVFLEKKVGEHTSFFIKDPDAYIIEFKTFTNPKETFF